MEKSQDEKKTAFVVLFSAVIMVLEIFFGLFSNSMALLADGIHMGSHVLAIGLSWGAYVLVRHLKRKQADNIDSEKVLTLAAYTSGGTATALCHLHHCRSCRTIFRPESRNSIPRSHGCRCDRSNRQYYLRTGSPR